MLTRKKVFASLLIFITLILLLLFFESKGNSNIDSLGDALLYGIVTLSTVGYGDYYPVTIGGRIIVLFFIFGSVGALGYLISQLTYKLNTYMENKKNGLYGTKFSNHVVIVGYDKFAHQVTKEIVASGKKVCIVTNEKSHIDLIYSGFSKEDVFALFTEFDAYKNLSKVNIAKSSKVLINFLDDSEMLVYVLNLKAHYSNLNIVISLNNYSLKDTFQTAGVLYAISKEEIASKLVASYIFEPKVAMFTEDLMSTADDENAADIVEFRVNQNNLYKGKMYLETFLDIKERTNAVLIGIHKNGKLYKLPSDELIIEENDILIIVVTGASSKKLAELFNVEQGG